MKIKKITLTLIVSMNEETEEYYLENEPDLHEALVTSDIAKLVMEDSNESVQTHWGE